MVNFCKQNLLSCCVRVFGEIWVDICIKMQMTNVRRCLIYNHENILIFLICLCLLTGKLETRKKQKPKKFLWLGQTNKPFYSPFVVNWKLPNVTLSPPAISPKKCPWTPGYFWHFLKLYMLTLNPPLTLCFELIGVTVQVVTYVSCNISNTGKSVSSDIQTLRSGLKKMRHSRVFF